MTKYFDKIAGYQKEKELLLGLREMLMQIDTYRENGIRIPKGILLYGTPGVGKSVMARAIPGDDIKCFELRSADCTNDDAGDFITETFAKAREEAPAVVLIDEIDKITECHPEYYMEGNDRIMKILLQELDGQKDNSGVLVVATCNNYRHMNPALLRAGRFDRVIEIANPKYEDRLEIIKLYLDKIQLKKDVSVEYFGKLTAGYSGAQLECIINEAAILAIKDRDAVLNIEHIQTAINRMFFSALEENVADAEKRKIVAVHEAGHAIVSLFLSPDKLVRVSVIPQGNTRGYVRSFGREREDAMSVAEMENQIKVSLAGGIAEREVLGCRYTGSEEDLDKAIRCSDRLICGTGAYGYEYLISLCHEFSVSDKRTQLIEARRTELLNNADREVTLIINKNRGLFDLIVKTLQDKFTLTGEELLSMKKDWEALKEKKISA